MVGRHDKGGVNSEIVSFSLFTQCAGGTQLVFGFLSEGIVPYVTVDSGLESWEGVSTGTSYIIILNQNFLNPF